MSSRTSRSKQPAKSDVQVTPEEGKVKNINTRQEAKATEPVSLKVETPSSDPVPAPEITDAEKIQMDIREKLSNHSVDENIFVPSNPASLENAARQIAHDCGFEFTRGTAVGARIMARVQRNAQ